MTNQRKAGFLIAKIHQISGRILSKKLKEYGITELNPSQGRIMFVLWQNDGISINQLAKKTALGKSTLTSMLDRLENSDFLKRIASKDDRRKIIIKRTKKDKNLQKLYQNISNYMTELYYSDFSAEEIDRFERYLEKIFDNLNSVEKMIKISV